MKDNLLPLILKFFEVIENPSLPAGPAFLFFTIFLLNNFVTQKLDYICVLGIILVFLVKAIFQDEYESINVYSTEFFMFESLVIYED